MMSFLNLCLAAGAMAILAAGGAQAAPLQFNFSGQVSAIISNDSSGTFGLNFAVGNLVSGFWAFDSTAAELIPGSGRYPASFSATLNGKTFSGPAEYRIFDNSSSGDGFSAINETGTYTGPSLGPLLPRTFFIQFLGMPNSTIANLNLIADPVALIPLSTPVAPHGFRLDNPDGTFGGLYFTISNVSRTPEPGTAVLMTAALSALALWNRRRKQ